VHRRVLRRSARDSFRQFGKRYYVRLRAPDARAANLVPHDCILPVARPLTIMVATLMTQTAT
jgi:hypothetical protein